MWARWAWDQIDKENDLIKLGAKQQLVQVLAGFDQHAQECDINILIKECGRNVWGSGLDDEEMRRLLSVCPLVPCSGSAAFVHRFLAPPRTSLWTAASCRAVEGNGAAIGNPRRTT